MIGFIIAAASAVEAGVKGVSAVQGALGSSGNARDQQRIAAAQSALEKALAGDSSQLAYMIQERWHSATEVSHEAFRRALVIYDSRFGTNYANAPDPESGAVVAPTPQQAVVQQTTDNVRRDIAQGAQQLLTGGANKITHAISPSAGFSIPFTQGEMLAIGAIVLIAGYLLLKKH